MATKRTLFRETTDVPVTRSVAGIIDMLVQAGARTINQEYASDGKITGIRFTLPVKDSVATFALPARVHAVEVLLKRRKQSSSRMSDANKRQLREKSERIAWRQLFAWVEAQLAMIQSEMVEPAEVFLPYALSEASGLTFFQVFKENGRLLAEGKV